MRDAGADGPLAARWAHWKREKRVSIAHVMRYGGVARHTIEAIRDGRTRQPSERVLRGLARGLAADPYDGATDPGLEREIYRDLRAAALAGGLDDAAQAAEVLRAALAGVVGDAERASAWAETVERLSGLDAAAVRALGRGRASWRPV